ncbi:MAG: hypothetical protein ACLS95_05580 [Clostridia bacterium]
MAYRNIGFSNIRLPDDDTSYIYKYDYRVNTFPEEVFIHEFLHTLERNAQEYNYTIPQLHDNEKYGYSSQKLIGLKNWYQDYMNQNIKTNTNHKIGLPKEIFKKKPVQASDFEISHRLEYFKEPQNIIEEIQIMVKRVISMFQGNHEIS